MNPNYTVSANDLSSLNNYSFFTMNGQSNYESLNPVINDGSKSFINYPNLIIIYYSDYTLITSTASSWFSTDILSSKSTNVIQKLYTDLLSLSYTRPNDPPIQIVILLPFNPSLSNLPPSIDTSISHVNIVKGHVI